MVYVFESSKKAIYSSIHRRNEMSCNVVAFTLNTKEEYF